MIDAARGFLALLQAPPAGDDARLAALCLSLDRLVLAYHSVPDTQPSDVEAPESDSEAYLDAVALAFPDLGLYPVVAADMQPDPEITMGDAQDDLVDIARDLTKVIWLFDTAGPADAAWEFRLGYRHHWGRQLHDLRRYLHARMFEADRSIS